MLTRLIQRGRGAPRDDAGITLMELVVAMSLMTLIGAMTLTFFVDMNKASSKTVDANISTSSARNVLDSWTALLRLADSPVAPGSSAGRVEEVTPTEIVFYTNLGNRSGCSPTCSQRTNPTKIDLALIAGQLVEKRFAYGSGGYPTTPTTTRRLGDGVTTSGWLFTPYTAGNPPTAAEPALCPSGAAGICTGTAGADTVLNTIVRVDVAFSVAAQTGESAQGFVSSAAITGGNS